MKPAKRLLLLFLVLTTSCALKAQTFDWRVGFDFRFDNREGYDNTQLGHDADGTIFGVRLTPEVGLAWGKRNSINVGVDLRADFGAEGFYIPEPVVYYNYNTQGGGLFAGIVPRDKTIGRYSPAFFSDRVRFYDTNIEGLIYNRRFGSLAFIEFACDWNGMESVDRHEKFMLFSSSSIFSPEIAIHNRVNLFFELGYNFNMLHFAGSKTVRGVVDNLLVYPKFIAHFGSKEQSTDLASVEVGWLQAFQNARRGDGYVRPGGLFIDVAVNYWLFGVRNSLYLGQNLMPYYDSLDGAGVAYGSRLYYGEDFFRTDSGIYNRLEVSLRVLRKNAVNMEIASIHHYDGRGWGWQQVVKLTVDLNKATFRRKE